MWLMRAPQATGTDDCLAMLRACPPDQHLTVRVSLISSRARRSLRELVQAHAYAAQCRVSLVETHGIGVRWVDGIVAGSAEQLAEFVTTVSPALDHVRGRALLAA